MTLALTPQVRGPVVPSPSPAECVQAAADAMHAGVRRLLRQLYPPQPPRGLWATLIWMRLYAAAYPYASPVRRTAEVSFEPRFLIGFAPFFGMPALVFSERQGLDPLPHWTRDA